MVPESTHRTAILRLTLKKPCFLEEKVWSLKTHLLGSNQLPFVLLLQMTWAYMQLATGCYQMVSKSPERRQRAGVREHEATVAPLTWLHSDLVSGADRSEGDSGQPGSHLVLICPRAYILTDNIFLAWSPQNQICKFRAGPLPLQVIWNLVQCHPSIKGLNLCSLLPPSR